jgi:glutamine amidotransferase
MQLFGTTGYEEKETPGLNWIEGDIVRIRTGSNNLKIPHMGWNELEIKNSTKVFENVRNKSHAYFIHSYEFLPKNKKVVSLFTNYGKEIVAAVCHNNIYGSQFHPEKSQTTGIEILTSFLKI